MEILFVVVGLAVGAVATYLLIQKQLIDLKTAHRAQTRRMREDMERDFELRMQTAVQSAQSDHSRAIQQVRDDYEQRIALLKSQSKTSATSGTAAPTPSPAPLADPWDNHRAVEAAPVPAPEPVPTPEPAAAPESDPVAEPEPASAVEPEPVVEEAVVVAPVISRPAIAQLKQACNSTDPEVRALVADELADHLVGAEAAQSVALLEKLAGDRDATVRVAALETLADAQIPDTIPILAKALRDVNPAVVRVASKGLQGMKGEASPTDYGVMALPSNGVTQISD